MFCYNILNQITKQENIVRNTNHNQRIDPNKGTDSIIKTSYDKDTKEIIISEEWTAADHVGRQQPV